MTYNANRLAPGVRPSTLGNAIRHTFHIYWEQAQVNARTRHCVACGAWTRRPTVVTMGVSGGIREVRETTPNKNICTDGVGNNHAPRKDNKTLAARPMVPNRMLCRSTKCVV